MSLSIIVAMTEERVIGVQNKLPWHLSDDLKRFKQITMGHPIIMGRKTFESIGKPLPGRQNIVVTRALNGGPSGVTVAHSLEAALAACEPNSGERFVIGGARLFEAALPLCGKIYMTLLHKKFVGDVFFPAVNLKTDFEILEETRHKAPDGFSYSFIVFRRK